VYRFFIENLFFSLNLPNIFYRYVHTEKKLSPLHINPFYFRENYLIYDMSIVKNLSFLMFFIEARIAEKKLSLRRDFAEITLIVPA